MGKNSGKQKVVNETKLPAWYESGSKDAISFANQASDNLAMPYMGNTVAGLDPLQSQAIGLTGQNIGSTNPAFQQAGQTAANVANYTPGNFLQGDVGAYMNPYLQNVEQAALGNMDRAYRQNLNTIADGAINAGAFGGSRQGVAEGVAASENARQMGDLSAQLRAQGYGQAAGMMQSDMDRQMAGQGMNLQAAGLQGDLAASGQQANLQGIQAALSAGQINQAQAQALLNQEQSQYDAMRNVPLEQLNIRMAPLGGMQVGSSATQTTPTSGSPFGSALGGALSGASLGSALFAPATATAAGGALSGLGLSAGMGTGLTAALGGLAMSDEDEKTNIQPIGIDGMTGLPMYAYDYKADVAKARKGGGSMPPKRVGPMAQDMPPDMVRSIGGKKIVRGLI
jgi:hypothetical protein